MTTEPNLLNDEVYVELLVEAERLGKNYVVALNEQKKRQQDRLTNK
jgi:hypothetical protein